MYYLVVDLIRAQFWKALRTLPWYVGIPFVLVGSVVGATMLMVSQPEGYHYTSEIVVLKIAAGFGFLLWVVRQAVRVLWTARLLQKQTISGQILPPR